MNRAENIMQVLLTTLTGLASTGANVQRSRLYPSLALPALTLAQGRNVVDSSTGDQDEDSITRSLEFKVTSHIAESPSMETILNQIASEVFAVLTADRSLGLGYVYDVVLQDDGEPDLSKSPTVSQVMTWAVLYEHSNTSTEV